MRIIGRKEIEELAQGGVFHATKEMIVTPLALDWARERGIHVEQEEKDLFTRIKNEVRKQNPNASDEDIRIAYQEVMIQTAGKGENASYYRRQAQGKQEKAVVSVTGKNRTGVVARVSEAIAKENGNILDIQQTIVNEFFTMVVVVDISGLKNDFSQFRKKMLDVSREIGVDTRVIHEGVLHAMHRI